MPVSVKLMWTKTGIVSQLSLLRPCRQTTLSQTGDQLRFIHCFVADLVSLTFRTSNPDLSLHYPSEFFSTGPAKKNGVPYKSSCLLIL